MNIRNAVIAAGSAIALSALATSASATGSVSTAANATATVLSPVTIVKTQDLVFGQVVRPSGAGASTVTLDTGDAVSIVNTGGANGSTVTSTTSSARFNITAPANTTYTTTQTLGFVQAGLTNVAPSLPVASAGTLGAIPAGGVQEIRYGGTFDMTSATTAQNYTGTLSVTVNYD